MIERLRDMHEFGSPDEAEAARLLGGLAPVAPPRAVGQRVFANLGVRRRFGPRAMHVVAVTFVPVLTLAVLGTALAMYFHRGAGTRAPAAPPRISRPAPAAVALAGAEPRAVAPPAIEPATPQPSATAASPEGRTPAPGEPRRARRSELAPPPVAAREQNHEAEPSAGQAAHTETTSAGLGEATEARVAAAPPEEATLVLAALRALRREHDPARAGLLLARYLERFPGGILTQEALALAIEAGLARGDRQAASGLAEEYLKRFPAGRFVGLARKAASIPRP